MKVFNHAPLRTAHVLTHRIATSAPEDAAPTDQVSLSDAPRWRPFTPGAQFPAGALPGPTGALVSLTLNDLEATFEDLEGAGLTFSGPASRLAAGESLQVEGDQMHGQKVENLGDVAALEALYLDQDAPVENQPLVGALRHLQTSGVRFFDNTEPEEPEIGTYGAWRMLKSGQSADQYVVKLGPIPTSVSGALHVDSARDVQRTAFFDFGGPGQGLPEREAAAVLRDLGVDGVDFDGYHDADQTWETLLDKPGHKVKISMGNQSIGELSLAELRDPGSVAGDLPVLAQFYGQALAPRVAEGVLFEGNAGAQLGDLREDLAQNLRLEALDTPEYEQLREEYLDLAHAAGDVEVARGAWELVGFELGTESRAERGRVMKELLKTELELGVLPGEEPEEGDTPAARALDDYKLLLSLRQPGQSLAQAGKHFQSLLRAMAPKEGWEGCRHSFIKLQKGATQGRFPGHDLESAHRSFVQRYLLTESAEQAESFLRTGESAGELEFEESSVLVGDQSLEIHN